MFFVPHKCKPPAYGHFSYPRQGFVRAVSYISQVFTLENALNGKINFETAENIDNILIQRMYQNGAERVFIKNAAGNKGKKLSEKEIKKYKLENYAGNLVFTTPEGFSVMLYKFEQNCRNVDIENTENSSCIITVDLNGYNNAPNTDIFDESKTTKTDRYNFIIDGNKDKIIIQKKYSQVYFKED